MELTCPKCKESAVPVLSESGPHIKAECPKCGSYIKFISERELANENKHCKHTSSGKE